MPIVFVTGQQSEEVLRARGRRRRHRLHSEERPVAAPARPARSSSRSASARPRRSRARAVERRDADARARDEILAVVSHDLRGPLHAISLATEALRDEISGPAGALPRRDRARIDASGAADHRPARGERDRERRAHAGAGADRLPARSCARRPPSTSCSRRRAAAGSSRIIPDEQIAGAGRSRSRAASARQPDRQLAQARQGRADRKLTCRAQRRRTRSSSVRDQGPGIAPDRAAARVRSLLDRPHEEGRRRPRARDRQGHRRPRTAARSPSRASTAKAPKFSFTLPLASH